MYCPECRSEYRAGIAECSDCGVPLVEALDPSEQPLDDAVLTPLTESRDSLLISELADRLEKAEVPYVITAGTGLALLDYPDQPQEQPAEWEARILVYAPLFERARRILQQLRPNAP